MNFIINSTVISIILFFKCINCNNSSYIESPQYDVNSDLVEEVKDGMYNHSKYLDEIFPESIFINNENNSTNRANKIAKIRGGEKVSLLEFPFFVLLKIFNHRNQEDFSFCGGTILTNKFVLTAAHCIHNKPTKIIVYAAKDTFDEGGIKYYVEKYRLHPRFNNDQYLNDIAIIKLRGTLTYSDSVQRAYLPNKNANYKIKTVETVGFGISEEKRNAQPSKNLMRVYLELYSESYCQKAWGHDYKSEIMICAGAKGGEKDACQGDSGGPLMARRYDPTSNQTINILFGVTSFGAPCGHSNKPGVWTRVLGYNDWINESIIELSSKPPYYAG